MGTEAPMVMVLAVTPGVEVDALALLISTPEEAIPSESADADNNVMVRRTRRLDIGTPCLNTENKLTSRSRPSPVAYEIARVVESGPKDRRFHSVRTASSKLIGCQR